MKNKQDKNESCDARPTLTNDQILTEKVGRRSFLSQSAGLMTGAAGLVMAVAASGGQQDDPNRRPDDKRKPEDQRKPEDRRKVDDVEKREQERKADDKRKPDDKRKSDDVRKRDEPYRPDDPHS